MSKKRSRLNGIFLLLIRNSLNVPPGKATASSAPWTGQRLIHADFYFFSFGHGTMEAHFHLIQVNMDDFFAVGTDFCDLPVEIDWISATWTARNDNSDDFCLLLHDLQSFRIWVQSGDFITMEGVETYRNIRNNSGKINDLELFFFHFEENVSARISVSSYYVKHLHTVSQQRAFRKTNISCSPIFRP